LKKKNEKELLGKKGESKKRPEAKMKQNIGKY
jgi:hypothetical protein